MPLAQGKSTAQPRNRAIVQGNLPLNSNFIASRFRAITRYWPTLKHNSMLIRLFACSVGAFVWICLACHCLGENVPQNDAFASFREFFRSKPAITNLIFDRTLLDFSTGKFKPTLLYQGRLQTNGWCIRELGKLEDANKNEVLNPRYLLAGHYNDTYWVLEGVVKKFTREQINDPSDPQPSYLNFGRTILFEVLDFGIPDLDEESMKWSGDEFTAIATIGLTQGKLAGKVSSFSEQGRVQQITYHFVGDSRVFFINYQYDNTSFDLPYFPSELVYSIRFGGSQLITNAVTRIYAMKISQHAINQLTFEPGAYMKGATNVLSSVTVIEKDRKLYEQLPGGGQIPVQTNASHSTGHTFIRRFVLSILILTAIVPPLLFVLFHKKPKPYRRA
jgi:hypothetical protein